MIILLPTALMLVKPLLVFFLLTAQLALKYLKWLLMRNKAKEQPYNPSTATFADVAVGSTFFSYIETMAHYGWVSGYNCGGSGEPCGCPSNCANKPYFRPFVNMTRSQFAKVAVSAFSIFRAYITPSTATFSDAPVGSTFYTYIETLYAHFASTFNGSPGYSDRVFHTGDTIERGDVAFTLFSATSLERSFGHGSVYAGSNNYDVPPASCNSTIKSGSPTFLPGELAAHAIDATGFTTFRAIGREIQFDPDAVAYLSCGQSSGYRVGMAFHVFDNFGSGQGCQDISYSPDWYTNLPAPVDRIVKGACPQYWGDDTSETRILTTVPSQLHTNSAEYFAVVAFAPHDHFGVTDAQVNIDNYQIDANNNVLHRDNLTKACFTTGSNGSAHSGYSYAMFPCP